jgi:signal transduction histidine kinase
MPRAWVWLQLLLGWLPVGTLFALMLYFTHGGSPLSAIAMASQLMLTAAALGVYVHRFTERVAWPHPLRLAFVGTQLAAAIAYAMTWAIVNVLIASTIASVLRSVDIGRLVLVLAFGPAWGASYVVLGFWLYVMTAGIAYANRAAARSAEIEAQAARAQLAALRAQLHPHLLFNALHTVVQLIPLDPPRAARAAEEVAGLLRAALAEQRDVVTLSREWAFVQRYLAIESLRFGDRLQLQEAIEPAALGALLPAFALQTLVENAVRHAAAPRIETTCVTISARIDGDVLALSVGDDGAGADAQAVARSEGTGLRRLRERLGWLCAEGRLSVDTAPGRGFTATLRVPQPALRGAQRGAGDD